MNYREVAPKSLSSSERLTVQPGPEHVAPNVGMDAVRRTLGTSPPGPPGLPGLLNLLAHPDGSIRAQIVNEIQRLHGNAGVQRLVLAHRESMAGHSSASPTGPMLQRQPQTPAIPTVDVRDLPFANKDQEQIRKDARESLPIWADTFANLWYTANNGALGATAEPEDPDFASEVGALAKKAFGIALAGNLVWAATCLTPAGAAVTIAMSFGGAAVGSGALTVFGEQPKSSQPSFKLVAAGALAKARDGIAAATKNLVKEVADDCASNNISDIEEQKKRLWAKMFSSAYNQAEPIETAAAAKLAKGAQSFVAAWQAHKKSPEVDKEAWRRTDERIKREGYPWYVWARWLLEPGGPGGPKDEYRLGIFNEEKMKYAVESFKPTLSFG